MGGALGSGRTFVLRGGKNPLSRCGWRDVRAGLVLVSGGRPSPRSFNDSFLTNTAFARDSNPVARSVVRSSSNVRRGSGSGGHPEPRSSPSSCPVRTQPATSVGQSLKLNPIHTSNRALPHVMLAPARRLRSGQTLLMSRRWFPRIFSSQNSLRVSGTLKSRQSVSVPEAAVDEDHGTVAREHQVGAPR